MQVLSPRPKPSNAKQKKPLPMELLNKDFKELQKDLSTAEKTPNL